MRRTAPGLLVDAAATVLEGATVGLRAVLGPGCRVMAGAEVRDSVLLEGCTVGEGARVSGSILAPASRSPPAPSRGAVIGAREKVPA